jgi:hypothetical protein
MAAAAVADDVDGPNRDLPHLDFLRRMAAIDEDYATGRVGDLDDGADVIDFASARKRLRS